MNYRLPQHLHGDRFRGISVGANIINPLNFVSSNFDPEVAGSGITPNLDENRQNRVGLGGFAYGQMSPNREFHGTVRIDF